MSKNKKQCGKYFPNPRKNITELQRLKDHIPNGDDLFRKIVGNSLANKFDVYVPDKLVEKYGENFKYKDLESYDRWSMLAYFIDSNKNDFDTIEIATNLKEEFTLFIEKKGAEYYAVKNKKVHDEMEKDKVESDNILKIY